VLWVGFFIHSGLHGFYIAIYGYRAQRYEFLIRKQSEEVGVLKALKKTWTTVGESTSPA
jgi:hypothetical protein